MSRTTTGIAFAAGTAVISGIAVFLNSFAVKEVSDPAVFTTLKNGVACLVLVGIALVLSRSRTISLPWSSRSCSWPGRCT